LPNLLSILAGKALMQGFEDEPASHGQWVRTRDVPEFKTQSRVARSEAASLLEVTELAEYKHGSFGERAETYALKTRGRIVSISRQAIINDDLGALTDLAGAFGAAGARLEADTVYAPLTVNGNMSDGNPVFDAAHSNIGTTAALSVSSLSETRSLMRRLTGLSGPGRLNITPRCLIVPASPETTGEQLFARLVDPARANDTTNPGWVRGLELVVDARLDDESETVWYVAGTVTQVDTVEVGYLDGQRGVSSTRRSKRASMWTVGG
jgi:hypothetical protein